MKTRSPLAYRNDSGQSMVELALSLPLFVLLVLGTAEIANIAWAAIQINNAARAGAQFASQSHLNAAQNGTDSPINAISSAAKADAPNFPQMTVTSSQVCKCISSAGVDTGLSCTPAACVSPDVITDFVQVNTQASITPFVHYPGLPASYTIKGYAFMGVSNK
jgi:Flp pilus assembly protein TadG